MHWNGVVKGESMVYALTTNPSVISPAAQASVVASVYHTIPWWAGPYGPDYHLFPADIPSLPISPCFPLFLCDPHFLPFPPLWELWVHIMPSSLLNFRMVHVNNEPNNMMQNQHHGTYHAVQHDYS
uniref:Uncharacterized protein n=1 Tax=Eutreptiella gymnastica TaxID=73025 RepID=A0A7S1J1A8_9EUGL